MDTKIKISKRGRPPVEINWPDVVFTAQDVVDTSTKKISRVTIHSKLNKAVDEGTLTVVGMVKTKNGRPRVTYKKSEVQQENTPYLTEDARNDQEVNLG